MIKSPVKQSGFILVAAIWVMAILIMMVGAFALWVEASLERALQQNQMAQMQRDVSSTRSILLYIAATQSATQAGITLPAQPDESNQAVGISLDDFFANVAVDEMGAKTVSIAGNELSVDGTAYKGIGDTRFSAMDLGGLIPLNAKSLEHTERLLRYLNVEPSRIPRLTTTVQDFLDRDDVLRPNGAETFQYLQRGMKPPTNTDLLSRFELRHVLGWSEIENLWNNKELIDSLAANSSSRYNVNAMPSTVAKIVFGLSESEVELFIRERAERRFSSTKEIVDRTKIDFYAHFDKVKLTPSSNFRFSFWYPHARLKREVDVHFLSVVSAGESPWIVSRDLVVPISESDALVEPRQAETHFFR